MRAPCSARTPTTRASASALGHSSAQYGMYSSRSNASSSSSASASRGRSTDSSCPPIPIDLFDQFVHRDPRIADISAPPRVTSVDVARRAGVSQSTVSLVLSGKARGRISARTEETVRAAAAELGYRPNVAARALRTGVARSVALVVPDITNPFFGRVLRGAQRAAQGAGYTVVLVDIGNDRAWEAASLQALLAGPADGLLLFEADLPPGATEHAIQIEMCPRGLPVVRLDVEAGVDAAMDHLLGLGHEKIGHLASSFDAPTFDLRRDRIRERLGRTPPTVQTAFTFDDAARGRRAAARARTSPRSSATTTSSPAASTWPRANAGSRSRATCRWSASTTSTSRACSRRR